MLHTTNCGIRSFRHDALAVMSEGGTSQIVYLRVFRWRSLLDKLLVCCKFCFCWVWCSEGRPELVTLENLWQNQVCQVVIVKTAVKSISYVSAVHNLP